MNTFFRFIVCFCLTASLFAQESWVKNLPFKEISFQKGTGDIKQVLKNPKNSFEIYIATRNAGIWFSNNNGVSFSEISSADISQKTEAIAVDWNTKTLWAATEKGIFFQEKISEKWHFAGLKDVKNFTQILLLSEGEICVTAMGNTSSEKGVFISKDKGKNWTQSFGQVGVSSVIAPSDSPKTLFITTWDMQETACERVTSGKKSGIYKSTDSGASWKHITGANSGFIQNNLGKISLAAFNSQSIYALVDNRNKRWDRGHSENLEKLSSEDFLALEDEKINEFIYNRGLQNRFSVESLKNSIRSKQVTPATLSENFPISEEIVGAEIFHSNNGGETWIKKTEKPLDNVFYSKGYEVSQLAIHPKKENELYLSGIPLLRSIDGGKSWNLLLNNPLDTEVFQFSVDERQFLYVTNRGFFQSFDFGKTWTKQELPQTNAVLSLKIDSENENLFASVKNGGIFKLNNGKWEQISTEEGIISVTSARKIYISQPFGRILVSKNGIWKGFSPISTKLQRFSVETPLLISPQNNAILYTGSNFLFQSLNEGTQWNSISNDLTNGDKKGNLACGTLSAIAESPFQFGLLYTGSDDGMIYTSFNGGVSWQMVYSSFPQQNKVVALIASKHEKNRVYAVLKSIDNKALIFKSEDNGKTWDNLKSNLPEENIHTITEDDSNANLLYVGTQTGAYVSFDGGEKWHRFLKNLPNISVSEIVINSKEQKIYIGTQNRGVFSADISSLKLLKAAIQDQPFYPLKESYSIIHSAKWGNTNSAWSKPEIPEFYFDTFASQKGKVTIKISKDGVDLKTFTHEVEVGFNYIPFDITTSEEGRNAHEKKKQKAIYKKSSNGNFYLVKGIYQVTFENEFSEEERILEVK